MGRTLDNELYDKDIVVVVDDIRVVIDEIYEDYEVELFNKLYINYADEIKEIE